MQKICSNEDPSGHFMEETGARGPGVRLCMAGGRGGEG